ncbi:ATP-binding protein [Gorillibacterium massiliense]|uniref:sensor histidine kinase n=1 Tax=Gorillibacterium massiliense TaxID=1280390 RepID=UPI0004B2EA6A|nr:ATP-binding protein [Gorillibacterium massiliense]
MTASLASRLRRQLNLTKQREASTSMLYAISRQMTAVSDLRTLFDSITRQVANVIHTQVILYLPNDKNELELTAPSSWGERDSERTIARWVYQMGEAAGRGTHTLGSSSGLFVPLRTEDNVYGVMAVHLEKLDEEVAQESLRFLHALGSLAAVAIARVKLSEEAKLAQLPADSEKLRTSLLDSVSHELRTPLATIIGSVTALAEGEGIFSSEDRLELLATIQDGAMRMNRLVNNLLGMAKLESGMLRLNKRWCDTEDIIGVVLAQVKEFQQHRTIRVNVPEDAAYLYGDEVLLEQALVNVVSNAIKYSSDHSVIEISALRTDSYLSIRVADSGFGLSEEDRERIFEKFYRAGAAGSITGTGLGLAIGKGIMELHGGDISVEPNGEKGSVFTLTLLQEETLPDDFIHSSPGGFQST